MKKLSITFIIVALSLLLPRALRAQVPVTCYRVETLSTPEGIAPEVSAVACTADGRLFAGFRLGTIWWTPIADPLEGKERTWNRFASGLLWPLGILPGEPGELFVAQMPELTRIVDTDGDGVADLYETVCDGWGLGGNYHEFLAGPIRDEQGNFYIALGCSSSGGPLRPPVRGRLREQSRTGKLYGHHSPVPYRGWVVKISPTGELTPFACGFRQPNGIAFNSEGDLFAVDNQGDWVGTSPLHHVTKGGFHGHPASLVWEDGFKGYPKDLPIETLRARRKLPAIQFPQNDLAGSTAQPLLDATEGGFGPYTGQLFIAEFSHPRILRVALENVGGEYQGACFLFLEANGLRHGNNRMVFSPDGNLYVAQVSRLWGGTGEGLQRLVWTGKTPMDILTMRLLRDGFELTFTKPVDPETAASPSAYSLQHYYYLYHATYGSPKQEATPVKVTDVSISEDRRKVRLTVSSLVPQRVYDLRPRGIRAIDGDPLITRIAAYTLNRLRQP